MIEPNIGRVGIQPTNGRIVWYTPAPQDAELGMVQHDKTKPLPAIIVHVWGDRMVNLTVFDSNGFSHPRTSVQLVQDGDPVSNYGRYCEWMPYQKGQAAKTEAAEQRTADWKRNAAAAIGGG